MQARLSLRADPLYLRVFEVGYGRTLSENSLKVICNARWPGRIPADRRIRTPWLHLDLFAVFAGLAGAQIPRDRRIDARQVWPLFEGREMKGERTFYWTFGKEDAIREGDWKLRLMNGKVRGLYNLAGDPGEKKDLSSAYAARVERLTRLHAKWKGECEAHQTSTAG